MSFPKTIEDISIIGLSVMITDKDILGKPFKPAGEKDGFILQTSVPGGPYYDFIFGLAHVQNFGSVFSITVRNGGFSKSYHFQRLAHTNTWIWTNAVGEFHSVEVDRFINWAFCHYYSEIVPESKIPSMYTSEPDEFLIPTLSTTKFATVLEEERKQKEIEEDRKAEAERAEARRLAEERAEAQRKAEAERAEAEAQRLAQERADAEAQRLADELMAEIKRKEAAALAQKKAEIEALKAKIAADEKAAAEKARAAKIALVAKQLGAKDWFLRTLKSSSITPEGMLKDQLSKLSEKDMKLFSEFFEDSQIGLELFKKWWTEYKTEPQITF